jgi:hypothetical protein
MTKSKVATAEEKRTVSLLNNDGHPDPRRIGMQEQKEGENGQPAQHISRIYWEIDSL